MKNQVGLVDIIDNKHGLYIGNLRYYFQVLLKDSTNMINPYHNIRHILHVLWQCYDGGVYHKLGPRKMRDLLIAAIFHDFNHSGKSLGKDWEEIEVALMSLRHYILPEDRDRLIFISNIIKATQFPCVVPENELTISMRIIRDADISQNFSPAWIQQCWIGLAEEFGVDPINFLGEGNLNFLKGIKFYSVWGQEKFEEQRLKQIQEVETYVDILNNDQPPTARVAA